MKTNVRVKSDVVTHEGAPARRIGALAELRRSVMACMLWEDQFYEDGASIADRIKALAKQVAPDELAELALEARTRFKLRHAPLLLVRELARNAKGRIVGDAIFNVIQRADEPAEFLSLYWQDGKDQPLSAQVKKGLARALRKFSAYQLAKYNRDGAVKLRDVLFLVHAKPKDDEQAATWKQLVDGTLPAPDTWEVALSSGADKKATWERLLAENKLGALALLRNLRNMEQAGVSRDAVLAALTTLDVSRVLPFRFLSAARAAPQYEPQLDAAMQKAVTKQERLPGRTAVLVDVSGSMNGSISAKSDLARIDAAKALAILLSGICDCRVFAFNDHLREVPARKGMALADAIGPAGDSTYLGNAVAWLNQNVPYDRIVVFTDEQSADPVPNPNGRGYMVNVASFKNGIGYGPWLNVTGFSESIVDYMREWEATN